MPSICMYILATCNSCCLYLSVSSRRNLKRFSLSFLCSFLLSSCSFNRFAYNSAILLTQAAKFPIACACSLGAWHFLCFLIVLFTSSVRTCFDFPLSHKQQMKDFFLVILFRLTHFRFLRRLTFPHSFYRRIPLYHHIFTQKIFLLHILLIRCKLNAAAVNSYNLCLIYYFY